MSDWVAEKYLCRRLMNPSNSCFWGELTLFRATARPEVPSWPFCSFPDYQHSSVLEGLLWPCSGKGRHSPEISDTQSSICASLCASWLLWGHIAQHFQNSAQIAEQTPILGLEGLVSSSVLQGEVSNCRITLGKRIILRTGGRHGGL